MQVIEETVKEIWKTIHDEDLFTRLVPISNDKMGKRVEWVLKNHYSDMVEESPMTCTIVKAELVFMFKEAGYF